MLDHAAEVEAGAEHNEEQRDEEAARDTEHLVGEPLRTTDRGDHQSRPKRRSAGWHRSGGRSRQAEKDDQRHPQVDCPATLLAFASKLLHAWDPAEPSADSEDHE